MKTLLTYIALVAIAWNLVVALGLAFVTAFWPQHGGKAARFAAYASVIMIGVFVYLLSMPASAAPPATATVAVIAANQAKQQVSEKQMVFGPSCLCERYENRGCYVSTGTITYRVYKPAAYVSEFCAGGKPVEIVATLYLAQCYKIAAVFMYETR